MIYLEMNLTGAQTNTKGLEAVLDIHSGSIGVAVIDTTGNTPKVLWSTRRPIDFLSEHDTDRLLALTKQTISAAGKAALSDGLEAVANDKSDTARLNNAIVYVSDPWHIGGAQKIDITDDEKFTVDKSKIDLAKEKAVDLFREEAAEKYQARDQKMALLETKILQIESNGYKINQSADLRTNSLSVHSYVSLLPKKVENIIRNQLSAYFNPDNIHLRSFIGGLQQTFTQLFSHPSSFIIVAVDEEITRLLIIDEQSIVATVPFQLGSHFLVRAVADRMNVPQADAHTKIKSFQDSDKNTSGLQEVVNSAQERWQDMFTASLDELSADISIPPFAYVLAEEETSQLFADFTRSLSAKDHLITQKQFRVHEVDSKLFSDWIDIKDAQLDHYLSAAILSGQLE